MTNYSLDKGNCESLNLTFQLFDKSVNRVLFDNCRIDDQNFATILKGLQNMPDVKSIIYKRDVFDEHSLEAINPLFKKRLPNHLEELKLEDLSITKPVLNSLLDSINTRSQLLKLSLAKIDITDQSFKKLQLYLINQDFLEDLNLTQTRISQQSWVKFF